MWLQLRDNLPADVRWQNVLGGLAPDSDQAMSDELQSAIKGHWKQIEATVGTAFNFDFWSQCHPRRDTYKACRAVIAAAQQQAEESMVEAIQKAYYLRAMNPSDPQTLADLAEEEGLDRAQFVKDMASVEIEAEFQRQLSVRDKLSVRSFPSLVLVSGSDLVHIRHNYQDYHSSILEIQRALLNAF